MKILSNLLVGLAVTCAIIGAALWIRSWAIEQQNKHVCKMLIEQHQKHEADIAMGFTPAQREYVGFVVALLEGEIVPRCADLTVYGKALLGLSVLLLLIVVAARRRFQDLATDRKAAVRDHTEITDASGQPYSPHHGLAGAARL